MSKETKGVWESIMEFIFGPVITPLQRVAMEVKNVEKLARKYTFEAEIVEREINNHRIKADNLRAQIQKGMVRQQILGELRLAELKRQEAQSYRAFAAKATKRMTQMKLNSGDIQLHTAEVKASIALMQQSKKFRPQFMQHLIKDFVISGDVRQEMVGQLEEELNEQAETTLGGDEEASEILSPASVEDRAQAQLREMEIEAGINVDDLINQMPSVMPPKNKKAMAVASSKK